MITLPLPRKSASRFILGLVVCWFFGGAGLKADDLSAGNPNDLIHIQSVVVDGKSIPMDHAQTLQLPPLPEDVAFGLVVNTNSSRAPVRVRYQLEGLASDSGWHEEGGEMYLAVRFYTAAGDQIGQQFYYIVGESAGWTGALDTSPLAHRRETLAVPPGAAKLLVVISSAGPPATVGVYAVNDLVVSKLPADNDPGKVLLRSPFGPEQSNWGPDEVPPGWVRDGTRPSMAKVVEVGQGRPEKALAILDTDTHGHAEWHNIWGAAPAVTPGDRLVIEWNEIYSMGLGDLPAIHYQKLPPGNYRFRLMGVTSLGIPTGVEASLGIIVPLPFWMTLWFWGTVLVLIIAAIVGSSRYYVWQRMQREMLHLKQQQIVEQERVRIAQDIHDDLGARVTQISLLSAVAQGNPEFPDKARGDFDRISRMTRDLVSALYETVWAVNPENDNLDALGNFLCQMVNQLCEQAQFRCRLDVLELPRDIQVSSQVRHNVIMAVKEAVNNIIKHARASEIYIHVRLEGLVLTVAIQDDGCGFRVPEQSSGNGLVNMKRRMEEIGGSFSIESQPGKGTTVRLRLAVKPSL